MPHYRPTGDRAAAARTLLDAAADPSEVRTSSTGFYVSEELWAASGLSEVDAVPEPIDPDGSLSAAEQDARDQAAYDEAAKAAAAEPVHLVGEPVTDEEAADPNAVWGATEPPLAEATVLTAPFDPNGHTVPDVVAYLTTGGPDGGPVTDDERARVLDAERAGQARKGIVGDGS